MMHKHAFMVFQVMLGMQCASGVPVNPRDFVYGPNWVAANVKDATSLLASTLVHNRMGKCNSTNTIRQIGRVAKLEQCAHVAARAKLPLEVSVIKSDTVPYGCVLYDSIIHKGLSMISRAVYNTNMDSNATCNVYDVCLCNVLFFKHTRYRKKQHLT